MANRFFLAVEIPYDATRAAAALAARVAQTGGAARTVKAENLHVTLHFLGDLPTAEPVESAMSSVGGPGFDVDLVGCGSFPSLRRPRVVWVGVAEPSGRLSAIHAGLGRALAEKSVSLESRPYRPHVTVAYVRRRASAADLRDLTLSIRAEAETRVARFTARRLVLYNSNTGRGGSVYTEIAARSLD